jgi:signal transduction histidine kinase
MLEFTKISCFDRKPTDLNMLVEETVSLFQQSASHQQHVVSELPREAPILDVDPVLIRHALFNLLINAAQENPPDGTITISLNKRTQPYDHAPGWCLSVGDEGPGLADDVKDKIFTPFFTTHAEGTGLGLPVVQQVAILHEGSITAANAEDGGALFALWLPDTEMDE